MDYFQLHPSFSGDNKVIIATCVVTDRAKGKWVKFAKQQLALGKYVYLTGCAAFERGTAMDYEAFFMLYPSLRQYEEHLFLLGEDPATYDENLQVAEYELNKEMEFEEKLLSSVSDKSIPSTL